MKTESVRKLDELGRIIIPAEMRNALCWENETKISVILEGEKVILRTYKDNCFLCSSEENLKPVQNRNICQKCLDEIKKYRG